MFQKEMVMKPLDKESLQELILQKEQELQGLKMQLSLNELENDLADKSNDSQLLLAWMNNLNVSVEVINSEGKFIFINDHFSNSVGYSKEQLLNMYLGDIDVRFADKGDWKNHFEFIKKSGFILMQGIHYRMDGTSYSVDINGKYVKIDGIEYVLAVTIDISDRILKEKQLNRSDALLNEIMSNTEEAIFLLDAASESIVDCNKRTLNLFGFEGKMQDMDLKGHVLQRFWVTEEEKAKIALQMSEKGFWKSELEFVHKEGHAFWCSITMTLLKIKNENTLYLIRLVDINQKKKKQDSLLLSEKRYKDLIFYNQTLICTHDLDGKILSINPACMKSLNYQNENELVGSNLQILFDPRNYEGYKEYLKQINMEGVSQGIMQVLNKQGKKMYWMYSNYRVDEIGEEPYVVGSAQDITDRMLIERELKKANVVAENSLKARELFLANISHEVRTPLHGIMGVTNLLKRTSVTPEQDKYLKIIKHSSESLLVIMNDILDIAKMESGKFELESSPFDLYDTIINAVQHLSLKAEAKGIQFGLNLPVKALPMLKGDPYRFSQIVVNLVNNAIKFTDSGTIELGLEASDLKNKVSIELKVTDTGIGISAEKLDTVFDEFIQADASHTRLYGGTGLGLSICKKLVELQGGTIYAKSEIGKGSEFGFQLYFDKLEKGFKYLEEKPKVDYNQIIGLNVLVVEDNPVNQLIAKTLLEMKGANVQVASSGSEAITLFKNNKFDLILMDIQMPDLDGDQVAAIIRGNENSEKASVTIIALTANAMKGDNEKYVQAGMNSYLSKPYTEQEFFQKIATTLNSAEILKEKQYCEQKEMNMLSKNQLYDLSDLEELFGDQEMLALLIRTFIETLPAELELLKTQLASQDFEGIRNGLHKIKPSLVQLKNEEVIELINELRESLINSDLNRINQQLVRLLELAEAILTQLRVLNF